jgi:acyl carrier protein
VGKSGTSRARPACSSDTDPEGDDAVVRQQVSDYLKEDLFIEFGPDDFSATDSLIEAGILDSLALVRLSLWIEQHFGIEIDFATLDSSAIDSLEKIVDYISRRTQ